MLRSFFSNVRKKHLALMIALFLLLTVTLTPTIAFIVTKTTSFINTFVSGLTPEGSLIVRKIVEHPFGEDYLVPDDIEFTFRVDLGEAYAGKEVVTSQGTMIADENGTVYLYVKAGNSAAVQEIAVGTIVTVTEIQQDGDGFTVKDEIDSKSAVISSKEDVVVSFVNTYSPNPVDSVNVEVIGVKNLEGRQWQEGDSFTFQLDYRFAGSEDEWMSLGTQTVTYELIEAEDPEDPEKTILIEKPDYNRFDFTQVIRSVSFARPGIYAFRISEIEGSIGGITYDDDICYFDVTVGDADMDGKLEIFTVSGSANADVTVSADSHNYLVTASFNNTYAPEGSAEAIIQIVKKLEDRSGQNLYPSGFVFELYDSDGQLVMTSNPTTAAGETGLKLVYDASQAGETFTYVLKERYCGETIDGITYDDSVHEIYITIFDNYDGTVRAVIYDELENDIAPEETEPSTETTVPTTESTESPTEATVPPTDETEPSTEVTDPTTEPVTEATEPVTEATEPVTESTEPVTETTEPVTEATEPATEATEPVTEATEPATEATEPVTEATEPVTEATEPVTETTEPATEASEPTTEATEPAVETAPAATEPSTDGLAPTISVTGFVQRNPGTSADQTASAERRSDKADTSPPSAATDSEDIGKTVHQTDGTDEGTQSVESTTDPTETTDPIVPTEPTEVTTEPTEPTADSTESVTVPTMPAAPDQDDRIPENAENIYEVTFVNVYEPNKASVAFGGTKKLSGRNLVEGEFNFLLYRTGDDFVIPENAEPLQRVRNGEEGRFNFESITFGKVGEYHFVVLEDTSDELGGVIYDNTRYLITVSVSDYHGILKAKYSVSDAYGNKSDIVFRNEYKAAALSLPVTGRKVLEDMELKEGMFRFSLYAADEKFGAIGNSLETVTHDADGVFTFKKLEFLKAGVYRYIVREDLSRQIENITYDHSVYGVTVTVTDDGSGVLTPGVHIRLLGGTDAEQIIFTNKYVAPETTVPTETEATETTAPTVPTVPPTSVPEPDGPPTGDETKLGMYVLSAMLSGFALITLWYLRKRRFCKK